MRLSLIVGLLLVVPTHAGDAKDEAAGSLVRTMGAVELVEQLVERSVRQQCEIKGCEVELEARLSTTDSGLIMNTLVQIAKRELTPAEMEAAIAYFRSEVGSRHLEVIRATRNVGKASLNDQPSEMRAAMLAFLDTPAGYRLVTRAMLTSSEEVNWLILRTAGHVVEQCRPAG